MDSLNDSLKQSFATKGVMRLLRKWVVACQHSSDTYIYHGLKAHSQITIQEIANTALYTN
jgi:hypothetical protein